MLMLAMVTLLSVMLLLFLIVVIWEECVISKVKSKVRERVRKSRQEKECQPVRMRLE